MEAGFADLCMGLVITGVDQVMNEVTNTYFTGM